MSHVTCTVEDGIAHVRLARPEKLNALTLDLLEDLKSTAQRLRRDKSVRVVIVSGEGDSFCAGLDFASVFQKPSGIVKGFLPVPWRGTNLFQEAPWAFRRIPAPVIAAVHGHCLGGGLQIALAADFRIATPDSTWSVLEGKWGLVPDMSGVRALNELLPIDLAKKLTMTAEFVSGKEAKDLGLVTELDSDPVAAAYALAERLKGRSPDALAAAKRLFDSTRTSSARRTFARERAEQLWLLLARNTRAARSAAMHRSTPKFGPRQR